jgi:hypothetical protein
MHGTGMVLLVLVGIAIGIFEIAACWKVLVKAGQPGWGVLIPFYNTYLFLLVAQRPGWWLVLYFIPIVNLVIQIIVLLDIAKNFGKSAGFGIGLFFLSFIFFPILGFGSATYQPAKPATPTATV